MVMFACPIPGEIAVIGDFIHLLTFLVPLNRGGMPAFVHSAEGGMAFLIYADI